MEISEPLVPQMETEEEDLGPEPLTGIDNSGRGRGGIEWGGRKQT